MCVCVRVCLSFLVIGSIHHADYMICRHCGNDISLSNFLLNVDSPNAVQSWNATFFRTPGVLVQELTNPVGGIFRVVNVKKAHCAKVDHVSR